MGKKVRWCKSFATSLAQLNVSDLKFAYCAHPRWRCVFTEVPLGHNLSLIGPPKIFLGIRKISRTRPNIFGPIHGVEILEIFGQILVRGPGPNPTLSQVVGSIETHDFEIVGELWTVKEL